MPILILSEKPTPLGKSVRHQILQVSAWIHAIVFINIHWSQLQSFIQYNSHGN